MKTVNKEYQVLDIKLISRTIKRNSSTSPIFKGIRQCIQWKKVEYLVGF